MSDRQKFNDHIRHEHLSGRAAVRAALRRGDVPASMGCVDGLTEKGELNLPGGILSLALGGRRGRKLLDQYMARQSGGTVTAHVHENCGYLCVIKGKNRPEQHKRLIAKGVKRAEDAAARHSVTLVVNIEQQGSAAPFMRKPGVRARHASKG